MEESSGSRVDDGSSTYCAWRFEDVEPIPLQKSSFRGVDDARRLQKSSFGGVQEARKLLKSSFGFNMGIDGRPGSHGGVS